MAWCCTANVTMWATSSTGSRRICSSLRATESSGINFGPLLNPCCENSRRIDEPRMRVMLLSVRRPRGSKVVAPFRSAFFLAPRQAHFVCVVEYIGDEYRKACDERQRDLREKHSPAAGDRSAATGVTHPGRP